MKTILYEILMSHTADYYKICIHVNLYFEILVKLSSIHTIMYNILISSFHEILNTQCKLRLTHFQMHHYEAYTSFIYASGC